MFRAHLGERRYRRPGTRHRCSPPAISQVGFAEKPRRATQVDLPAGSVLAFYTDGLVKRRTGEIDEGVRELEMAVTADSPSGCAREPWPG
ncbi:SpoIIE family protein phosphatase [Amycolatopsis sp. NPDC003865]